MAHSFHITRRDAFSSNKEKVFLVKHFFVLIFCFLNYALFLDLHAIVMQGSGLIIFFLSLESFISVCNWLGRFLETFVKKIQSESFLEKNKLSDARLGTHPWSISFENYKETRPRGATK